MKILMVSIFAPHFFNWTEQLKDSGHEIYWLDVFDSKTKVEKIDFVHQITDWRYNWDFPGRYFLKDHFPFLNSIINIFNENRFQKFFKDTVNEVQPDLIQSFIMQPSCYPIYNFMNKNPGIKWLYSSWGSDIYYYYNKELELDKMTKVFSRLDYMFTDCYRDYEIARSLGFKGKFLGVFPGGGGWEFKTINSFMKPLSQRNTILIKGYQGKHGRCLEVLKAMSELRQKLNNYEIVIFGAAEEVFKYIENSEFKNWSNIQCYGQLPHSEIIKLMGEALIYIGNSNSDGMPNTLLEAIIMGAFPIQSNPGGATAELVENGKNGLLIYNSEDTKEIQHILSSALDNIQEFQPGVNFNQTYLKPNLEKGYISEKVLKSYALINKEL